MRREHNGPTSGWCGVETNERGGLVKLNHIQRYFSMIIFFSPIYLLSDLVTLWLIIQGKMHHIETCAQMFTAAFFVITKM